MLKNVNTKTVHDLRRAFLAFLDYSERVAGRLKIREF